MSLQGKRIVVGLGGGIAAFKAVQLVRELLRRGAEVRVAMTDAATRFVGPITFAGLTGKPPVIDLCAEDYAGEVHVELGEWADAIVIAPATMNLMARAVGGQANDAVLATLACARGDVFFAPAYEREGKGALQNALHHECAPMRGCSGNGNSSRLDQEHEKDGSDSKPPHYDCRRRHGFDGHLYQSERAAPQEGQQDEEAQFVQLAPRFIIHNFAPPVVSVVEFYSN